MNLVRGMHPLATVALMLALLLLSYASLTNQTPYCYTLQEYSDGRRDYREFATSAEATRYENAHGFWGQRRDVVNEASGCASDKVYWWEGGTAGAFALTAFALPFLTGKRPGIGGSLEIIGKTLLGILTIGSLASLVSVGAIVAPLLIPFHWAAARRSNPWTRGVWIFSAGVCAWVLGQWATFAFLREDSLAGLLFPLSVSGAISVILIATSSTEFQDLSRRRQSCRHPLPESES